jgi:hypothetical protein
MSPEPIVTVAVASSDDHATLTFLSELWMAGAAQLAAPFAQGPEIPLAGRGASLEREGVRFVVRAAGSGSSQLRRDVLELANVVLLLAGQDESLNARYREALGTELRAIHEHDGVTVEKYVIRRGASAFSCLDALASKAERRPPVEAPPTRKVDVTAVEGLRQMSAVPADPSEAPTEHVSLAEIVTFLPPAKKKRPAKRRPAKGKKVAKKTRAKGARKPAKKARAKSRRR